MTRTAGVLSDVQLSYRYRLALFVRTRKSISLPSTLIATGPFGDVKNYTGTEFYLSWYPAGLMVNEEGFVPPAPPQRDGRTADRVAAETFAALMELLPGVREIASQSVDRTVEGGWVVVDGRGSLSDPMSSLHQRDRFGIARHGSYITVDTGKYSSAPWLAKMIAEELMG